MALYIDSAFLNDITNVAQTVPLAGVTTNPTILLAARELGQDLSPQGVLDALLRSIDGTIFMQPGATGEEEMYAEALTYIRTAPDRVIPKIPMTHTGMRAARRLKQQHHRIAFTAVTSVAQAYSAAMIEADFIIPYYGRLERSGIDASERIVEMADLRGTNLKGAKLQQANLFKAKLGGADLREANLHGVELGGANLKGANLREAEVTMEQLRGCLLNGATMPDGTVHP